ncbi:MAG: FecR domain-containing protein [Alphaproteobacteria bacterium]
MLPILRAFAIPFVLIAAVCAGSSEAAERAGTVTRIKGEASAAAAGAPPRPLSEGAEIFAGDEVKTGAATRLEITMVDDAKLTLGDNSRLVIDAYVFQPQAKKGNGALRVVEGVFRATSGKIGKLEGAPFRVGMPAATLGIRGTEFWGEVKDAGLLVALLDGKGVFLENRAGRVEITRKGYATTIASPDAKPSAPFKLTDDQVKAALATVAW